MKPENPSTAARTRASQAAPKLQEPTVPRSDCVTRAKLYRALLKAAVRKTSR